MKNPFYRLPHPWQMVWWDLWYGLTARLSVIGHKLRHPSHDVRWRHDPHPEEGCNGELTCETCSISFWCRGAEWHNAIGQWLCPRLYGHLPSSKGGWVRYSGKDDASGEPIYEPCEAPETFCYRCGATL